LPDTLLEAELFGHVRGAFTGAVDDRAGAFKMATRGTLFLDEIGDLSAKGQGDLLRVLEDGVYRPVGSAQSVHADVRIVAATNRDLAALANEGRFREDLLYRLNIVELHLTPLRLRTEDIPALVDSFNEHFCARHGRNRKTFTPEFMAALARHPWPGNIRQLRNLIERLVVTVRATAIDVDHAPPLPAAKSAERGGGGGGALFSVQPGTSLPEVEKLLIRETLARVTRNRREAARILGISPRALAYKIKLLHLGSPGTGDA
jgi:DNA-binding NtrC family response regulator